MRQAIPFVLAASCAAPLCVRAQTKAATRPAPPSKTRKKAATRAKKPVQARAPQPKAVPAPLDFDGQKALLGAIRVDTLDELRDGGRNWAGKTVEVRGEVKGLFGGNGAQSVLLQLPDGQTQLINASPDFASSPCAHVGNWMRALCRVQSKTGGVVLDLVRATDQPEKALFEGASEDTAPAPLRRDVPGAPPPDDVLITPEANLPEAPASAAPSRFPVSSPSSAPRPTPRRAPVAATPRANAFYGFDDSSRAAFKALAMRNNPRLSAESADSIAFSLLEAAQAQGLDPRFLAAVVQVESGFNPYCVSSAGALGLGQLMPFNLRPLGVQDGFDARQNLHGTARLLRQNLNIYARDRNGTMLAVAAYHAGVGAVNRAGRAIPKATTQRYVWKVYYAYRALAPELFR
jgi:soluble lytic murein transglycosylase-like protein